MNRPLDPRAGQPRITDLPRVCKGEMCPNAQRIRLLMRPEENFKSHYVPTRRFTRRESFKRALKPRSSATTAET